MEWLQDLLTKGHLTHRICKLVAIGSLLLPDGAIAQSGIVRDDGSTSSPPAIKLPDGQTSPAPSPHTSSAIPAAKTRPPQDVVQKAPCPLTEVTEAKERYERLRYGTAMGPSEWKVQCSQIISLADQTVCNDSELRDLEQNNFELLVSLQSTLQAQRSREIAAYFYTRKQLCEGDGRCLFEVYSSSLRAFRFMYRGVSGIGVGPSQSEYQADANEFFKATSAFVEFERTQKAAATEYRVIKAQTHDTRSDCPR